MRSFSILFILSAGSLLALAAASPVKRDLEMMKALVQSLMGVDQASVSEPNLQEIPVSEAMFQQNPVSQTMKQETAVEQDMSSTYSLKAMS